MQLRDRRRLFYVSRSMRDEQWTLSIYLSFSNWWTTLICKRKKYESLNRKFAQADNHEVVCHGAMATSGVEYDFIISVLCTSSIWNFKYSCNNKGGLSLKTWIDSFKSKVSFDSALKFTNLGLLPTYRFLHFLGQFNHFNVSRSRLHQHHTRILDCNRKFDQYGDNKS
jgi:hypothetical protein